MAKLYNLAAMTVASSGTGTITLGSAATINGVTYLSFASAGVSDGETVAYSINDVGGSEVGTGLYTASGTTLTRIPVTSTNSNAAINMTAAAIVKISPAKADLANLREANTFTSTNTFNNKVTISSVPAGTTALAVSGVGTSGITIDFNGGGSSYYDAVSHNFRSGSGTTVWAQLGAGQWVIQGGGASGYNQVILQNDLAHSYQFGFGGSTSASPDQFFIYNSSGGFVLTSVYSTGQFNFNGTTDSTSTTTGNIVNAGGLGVAKAGFFGGAVNTASVFKVSGTQVVGAHITGYTAMTGSPDKATAYATSTVTLAQLAGRVAQIQADLTTHGLIGA